ncbi:MAG: TetR/AcrR family transcriptional regulator [Phycisphaerales bacterium]|nr:TetR/AcrR family transcriptional regulator [Phycisphaerales bacterium]
MPPTTREQLMTAAFDVFQRDGFHEVGLEQILDVACVSKTTFYNHFESKDDLVLALLSWRDRWWRDEFVELLRRHGGERPRDQLLALGPALEEMFASGEFHGCVFVNVAVEYRRAGSPANRAAVLHKQSMEGVIRQLAAYAGASDPTSLAQEFSVVLEGAYVTRSVTGNPKAAEIAGRLATSIVERHLPAPAPLA